jgi:acrylyl-CoA reductase (NADPH)
VKSIKKFNCVQIEKDSNNLFYTQVMHSELLDEFVLIKVHYSSYNHKDSMVASGQEASRRIYPHTLGIDAAGEIVESKSSEFKAGDWVAIMATQAGISLPGGFSEYLNVPAKSITRVPEKFTTRDIMLFGTAGLTASLAVRALISGRKINKSMPVLVTGGSSGVGVISTILLIRNGYKVCVSTSQENAIKFFRSIGVDCVLNRIQNSSSNRFALLPEKWAGCIDVVGGDGLSLISKSMIQGGNIISVGSLAGDQLEMNLNPFYLRGVSLQGINTESLDILERRQLLSENMTRELICVLDGISLECDLNQVPELISQNYFSSNFGRHLIKI